MRDWNKFGVVVFTDLTEKRKLSLEVENFHRKWINLWPKKIIIQKHEIPKEMVWIGRLVENLYVEEENLCWDFQSPPCSPHWGNYF